MENTLNPKSINMPKRLTLAIVSLFAFASLSYAYIRDISYEEWKGIPIVVPQVIVFYADWCQPSQAYFPTVESIEQEYNRHVDFFMCNIDEEPEWVADFNVPVLPCTYFIYESDLDSGDYKWGGEKLGLSRYKLINCIEWTLDNWVLSGEINEEAQVYLEHRSVYFEDRR